MPISAIKCVKPRLREAVVPLELQNPMSFSSPRPVGGGGATVPLTDNHHIVLFYQPNMRERTRSCLES